MILKRQRSGQRTLRVNASRHAACRTSHTGRDARVSRRQQASQVRWNRPPTDLWSDRTHFACPAVSGLSQARQRCRAALSGPDQRPRPVPDHPPHAVLPPKRGCEARGAGSPPSLPDARGQPGFLRVDTVHQGDTKTRRGLYHINAVDTVTQWQVVGCCETISEAHLIPVLEAMLHQFPFLVQGFHSDNDSEFLNHRVAKLLNKLLVAEAKGVQNVPVVRKTLHRGRGSATLSVPGRPKRKSWLIRSRGGRRHA